MPKPEPPLSQEMKATADALRHIRARLNAMIAAGTVPADKIPAVSTVLIDGHTLVLALEELAI
jgi:hypothetical protein